MYVNTEPSLRFAPAGTRSDTAPAMFTAAAAVVEPSGIDGAVGEANGVYTVGQGAWGRAPGDHGCVLAGRGPSGCAVGKHRSGQQGDEQGADQGDRQSMQSFHGVLLV